MSAQTGSLVKAVSQLPDPVKKRVSGVIGAVVADAASLPLQWIYNDSTMKEIVGDQNPEFWPECKCPFFTVPTGTNSCYNDEMRTCLGSLAAPETDVASALQTFFGAPDSPYQIALAKRAEKKFPVVGPWINGGVIQFLKNSTAGISPPGSSDCEDNDGFTVSLPVFLKDPAQSLAVAQLLTTNSMVLDHWKMQTAILSNYLTGAEDPIQTAKRALAADLPAVCQEIDAVQALVDQGKSLGEIVEEFGKACGMPGSFQGSIAALLTHNQYVSAIRGNILSGGDCCSRSNFVGACLAARDGIEAVPMEWIEKVDRIDDVIQAALKIYQ